MCVFTLSNSITTDGRTNGRTAGPTDKASYRVACPQLKRQGGIKNRKKKRKKERKKERKKKIGEKNI